MIISVISSCCPFSRYPRSKRSVAKNSIEEKKKRTGALPTLLLKLSHRVIARHIWLFFGVVKNQIFHIKEIGYYYIIFSSLSRISELQID